MASLQNLLACSRGCGMCLVFVAAIILALSTLTNGQQTQQNLCSSRFEAALAPECFEVNQINFTGVIFVISQNRSGAIPPGFTYESFLELMCQVNKQDVIIPCVLRQMQKYNSTQCTQEDRFGVLGRGGQLLAFMDAVCGEPCEQEATQSLIQCYTAINVNPEPILNQNASIAEDKYSVIGENETEVNNFCSNRERLFSCLSPLYDTCPGLIERLYTIGIDLQAMEGATSVLCQDVNRYFRGLECFATPSDGVTQCREQTENNMRQVLTGRYQTGEVRPSQYMDKLCEAKLTQIDCELATYAQTCDDELSELRTTVECAMLPRPCRDNEQFAPVYKNLCTKVTTPSPVTKRPTKPPGGPGKVPTDDRDDGTDGSGDSASGLALCLPVLVATVVSSLLLARSVTLVSI